MNTSSRSLVLPAALPLDGGGVLPRVEIAYETYGTLAEDGSNAILLCHALTGDQYVASDHPVTGKPGWWWRLVGQGKPVDPARHFIICSNLSTRIKKRATWYAFVWSIDFRFENEFDEIFELLKWGV